MRQRDLRGRFEQASRIAAVLPRHARRAVGWQREQLRLDVIAARQERQREERRADDGGEDLDCDLPPVPQRARDEGGPRAKLARLEERRRGERLDFLAHPALPHGRGVTKSTISQ